MYILPRCVGKEKSWFYCSSAIFDCVGSCPHFLKSAPSWQLQVLRRRSQACFDLCFIEGILCSVNSTESCNWISFWYVIPFFGCQAFTLCDPPTRSLWHTQPSHFLLIFCVFRWTIRIMFNINLLENLKVYISSRPPLVVFMISVSAMAIAFLTLGYFFKIKEIKSPEMTEVGTESSWAK